LLERLMEKDQTAPPAAPERKRNLLSVLGPGLVTGAADDDPSGIGTHSQVGAQFGYSLSWTFVLSFPLMVAIQMVAAEIGRVTGAGIARNLRRHYPRPLLHSMVGLLLVANIINLGADLSAMGAALQLLIGGNTGLYTLLFGIACVVLEIWLSYPRYASILKWTTLSLFTYIAVVMVAQVPWGEALTALVVPDVEWSAAYMTALVAILGTTISPYLFFWQAGQEIEEQHRRHAKPLCITPRQAGPELKRIRIDTLTGMAFSTLVSLAIVYATAATLHAHGIRDIETSAQAALALRPIAGGHGVRAVRSGDHRDGSACGAGARGERRLCGNGNGGTGGQPRCEAPLRQTVLRHHRGDDARGSLAQCHRYRSGEGALLGGGGERGARRAADGGDDADRAQPARDGAADAGAPG
jgi:Mn2+/Fe2+ NRAMP family transporter